MYNFNLSRPNHFIQIPDLYAPNRFSNISVILRNPFLIEFLRLLSSTVTVKVFTCKFSPKPVPSVPFLQNLDMLRFLFCLLLSSEAQSPHEEPRSSYRPRIFSVQISVRFKLIRFFIVYKKLYCYVLLVF